MAQFIEQKRKWRAIIIMGMMLASLGPWTLELIAVSSEYACEFRLSDNLCGLPLEGLEVYRWYFLGIIAELIKGPSDSIRLARLVLVFLTLGCPLISFFNTSLLVLFKNYHPPKTFTIAFWCLTIGAGLLGALETYPEHFWSLWGLWMFIGLSISALGLEILFIIVKRKPNAEI